MQVNILLGHSEVQQACLDYIRKTLPYGEPSYQEVQFQHHDGIVSMTTTLNITDGLKASRKTHNSKEMHITDEDKSGTIEESSTACPETSLEACATKSTAVLTQDTPTSQSASLIESSTNLEEEDGEPAEPLLLTTSTIESEEEEVLQEASPTVISTYTMELPKPPETQASGLLAKANQPQKSDAPMSSRKLFVS